MHPSSDSKAWREAKEVQSSTVKAAPGDQYVTLNSSCTDRYQNYAIIVQKSNLFSGRQP
jgi:hypothetical protein